MTWPFENDTSDIEKKLAKKSLQSEKRRNLMVVIAVALAAFLICFTGIVSTSLTQMQRNQVLDTYEAVWRGVEENDIENLKGVPEFERVGGYYMLGEELSEQGYHASYVYCDAQMMEIAKAQMNLLEGRVPEKANEVVVSEYFLSTYGNNAKIGDTVTLDTESFHGDYVVTGIMDSVNEKEANTCAIILSKAALTEFIVVVGGLVGIEIPLQFLFQLGVGFLCAQHILVLGKVRGCRHAGSSGARHHGGVLMSL